VKIDEINIGCKKEDLQQCAFKLVCVYLDGKSGAIATLQNSPVNQLGFLSDCTIQTYKADKAQGQ